MNGKPMAMPTVEYHREFVTIISTMFYFFIPRTRSIAISYTLALAVFEIKL